MTEQSILQDWKETTLGEVAGNIFSGGTPNTQKSEYWNGNLNWLSSGETGQRFIYDTERKITELGASESSTRLANTGNIVIATAGQGNTRGQVSFLKIDSYINQSVIAINASAAIADNKWLFYNLSNRYYELRFISEANSIRGSLTTKIIESLTVPLPPLPEQKAIAAILSSFDDKIELLRRQNKTLESTAQTIFKEWFRKFNIKNEKSKIKKETGLPEGWRMGRIKDCGKIICGKTPPKEIEEYFGGSIPFIKIPDMHNEMFIVKTEDSLTGEGADFQRNKFIPKNSICVSCIATVGLVSITGQRSQTNQQINTIVPAKDEYLEYLYYILKNMTDELVAIGSGGSATLNINTGVFSDIEIILPPDDILKSYHLVTEQLFVKVLSNLSQIQTLSKLRDTLLPKLMKGEVRVEDVENLKREKA